jgi:hypothetical protein
MFLHIFVFLKYVHCNIEQQRHQLEICIVTYHSFDRLGLNSSRECSYSSLKIKKNLLIHEKWANGSVTEEEPEKGQIKLFSCHVNLSGSKPYQ